MDYEKLLETARAERQMHESLWSDCFKNSFPIRALGFFGSNGGITEANANVSNLYNPTAADSMRLLVSAIMGGMVPANSRWVDLDVADDPDYRDEWLDNAAETCWREIHASNFDAAAFDGLIDEIATGQFCMFIGAGGDGLAFEVWPLAEVFAKSTRSDGIIDTIYRETSMPVSVIARDYGEDMLPEALRNDLKTNPDRKVKVCQYIYPRETMTKGAMAKNMPIASVHRLPEYKKTIRESGFEEMPVMFPRWSQIPGSVYAYGPMYSALPAIKSLNAAERIMLEQSELATRGMWAAVDDGVLNPATIKIGAGRVITLSNIDNLQAINPPGNISVGDATIARIESQVRRLLLADRLQFPDDATMTATEANIRMELLRQLIGPVFARLQAEWLKPMIDRVFGILLRNGRIPEMPAELQTGKLAIRFISPLARSQRMSEVGAMQRFESDIMVRAQFRPEDLDVYDFEAADREKSWLMGVPQKLIRKSTDVEKIRKDRAKAQQEAPIGPQPA